MEIGSTAFENGGYIPAKYTCDSSDVSPSLFWKDMPSGTKSFALICDDPDAPYKAWVHWVVLNIPGQNEGLQEDIEKEKILADGTVQGTNDFGKVGYNGPCPPAGKPHRYFFKLYALNTVLTFTPDADITKETVIEAMQGHILAEAKVIGLYER
ncbi:MAG: YbhB/YbcL family Raf kinase inhibitor-like protein [Candidatus Omnitrophota bacterium]|nr:MAG: YbhB/YbcL family Raf kinase inhibitor-like protein [Candidatus Omnitrophota bacterium]